MGRSHRQQELFPPNSKTYGGDLLKTRKGRSHGRPLAVRQSMHLVLRSTVAKNEWSMNQPKNRVRITGLIYQFAQKHGIKVYSFANVGNHLHLHIQLNRLSSYKPFIRGLTAAIAMAITGISRWTPLDSTIRERLARRKFWDQRPFSRIVVGRRDFLGVRDYIGINQMEGTGVPRHMGEVVLRQIRKWESIARQIRARWRAVDA